MHSAGSDNIMALGIHLLIELLYFFFSFLTKENIYMILENHVLSFSTI